MTSKHTRQHGHGRDQRQESRKPRDEHAEEARDQPQESESAAKASAQNEGGDDVARSAADLVDPAYNAEAEAGDGAAAGADAQDGAASAARELEASRERHLRLAAEFDNYRKRTERERTENWTRAQAQLVERILDAIDDLQRVAHLDPEKTSASSVLEGVQLVERKLLRILEAAGLEILDAEGKPFDPEVHEALATAPAENQEQDDTVSDVFQKGYLFKGTLIRPARVRVFKHEG
jgi:molecular chaperone GrpE